MSALLSPQRFARGAEPRLEVYALSYWRACRVADHPAKEIAAEGLLQLVRLANHPKFRDRIRRKVEQLKIGEQA